MREAARLEAVADGFWAEARLDIQRADDDVPCVVLFATSLFFAGIGSRLPGVGARTAAVALGCLVVLGTVAWLATFPASVSV